MTNKFFIEIFKGFITDEHIKAEWCINAAVNHDIISSDNGLVPLQRQAIVWTNPGLC